MRPIAPDRVVDRQPFDHGPQTVRVNITGAE
jgi:hypothetical protein